MSATISGNSGAKGTSMWLKVLDSILMLAIGSAYICLIIAPFLEHHAPKPKREND